MDVSGGWPPGLSGPLTPAPTAGAAAEVPAGRRGARDTEGGAVVTDDRRCGERLASAVDHRDRLRVQAAEVQRLRVLDRARAAELQRAEVVQRDGASADARGLLDPLRGRVRRAVLHGGREAPT